MKKAIFGLFLLLLLIGSAVIMGQSDWHIHRNKYNLLPKGNLIFREGSVYFDQSGLNWVLQPQSKNIFHQPDEEVAPVDSPYHKIIGKKIEFDIKNPNLKFLSATPDGGSYEAIMQPDGSYLITGSKQGTYNYANPSGIWGSLKHTLWDVIPHFVNGEYE